MEEGREGGGSIEGRVDLVERGDLEIESDEYVDVLACTQLVVSSTSAT